MSGVRRMAESGVVRWLAAALLCAAGPLAAQYESQLAALQAAPSA